MSIMHRHHQDHLQSVVTTVAGITKTVTSDCLCAVRVPITVNLHPNDLLIQIHARARVPPLTSYVGRVTTLELMFPLLPALHLTDRKARGRMTFSSI